VTELPYSFVTRSTGAPFSADVIVMLFFAK
jgi:hypothetical protein